MRVYRTVRVEPQPPDGSDSVIGVFDDFDAKLLPEEDGLTIRKRWEQSLIEKNTPLDA